MVALDCGQVVNPNILEQQIQGAVVFGLANVLRAQITIDKGRVVQGNFDTYEPIRMNEAPIVEGYYVPSTEPPTGAGEPPIPPLGAGAVRCDLRGDEKKNSGTPDHELN